MPNVEGTVLPDLKSPDCTTGQVYMHYKGNRYMPYVTAVNHQHNGDKDVVYFSFGKKEFYTRPLQQDSRKEDAWLDEVEWPDGVVRQRFFREAQLTEQERSALLDCGKWDWPDRSNRERFAWMFKDKAEELKGTIGGLDAFAEKYLAATRRFPPNLFPKLETPEDK